MGAAGVVALAREACRHCQQTYCGDLEAGSSCEVGSRIRGGIVIGSDTSNGLLDGDSREFAGPGDVKQGQQTKNAWTPKFASLALSSLRLIKMPSN
jgi:hypothetical protein